MDSTAGVALKHAIEQLVAGCNTRREKFERLATATAVMCDPFPLPESSEAEVFKDRASIEVPLAFKTRMTGDAIRLCLIPGVDDLTDSRMSDVFTLMRIMVKYRTNMPNVVWLQLYEIAIKNFIHTTVDEKTKDFFRDLLSDPEVQALIEKANNDNQNQTEKG